MKDTGANEHTIEVVVEIPKGSRNKYEYDHHTGRIRLDRMLFSSVHYPSDYGFVIDTLAEDGDPLDALVLVGEPTFPGCEITAKPIGLFRMWDEMGRDDKILCVPVKDPQWNWINQLADMPQNMLREIEHFFAVYKELEEKKVGVDGWEPLPAALEVIEASRRRYKPE